MEQIQLVAPAKVNLTLDIIGRRRDGYHNLRTVMHQISLMDSIFLTRQDQGISLESGHPLLPNDNRNLAWRAADLMVNRYLPQAGISIAITKRIPIEAGLAGGSTDAAAVLRGMNQLFGLHLPLSELCECGIELGADVPFCLAGGTALCTEKGECMEPLVGGPHLHIVLLKPAFSLSTAVVYHQFDAFPPTSRLDHAAFLQAWQAKDVPSLASHMGNVLERVSVALQPEIGLLLERLRRLGALSAQMTGSGPAVFGIFPDAVSAQAAAAHFVGENVECFVTESFSLP